jgi:hypothetical protein
MNGGILSMNGRGIKNSPVVGEKGTEKGTVTNINTPQLTRLGERTIKMFTLHWEMIKALQKNAFELMTMLADYEEIDNVINPESAMISNLPETRYEIISASFAIENMFVETGGKIWQELADRLRQEKNKK